MKDPATEEEDFRKIVDVLVRARPSTKSGNYLVRSSSSPVSRQLVSLVKGAAPDFGWALHEPSRRAFALQRLDHTYDEDLVSTSKTILKDEFDQGLLVAAAQYIEANGGGDSASVLENAFNKTRDDLEVSGACLKALARIQSGSPIVQRRISDLTSGRAEKLRLLEAPALAAELLKDAPRFERRAGIGTEEVDPDREQKQNYAEQLIRVSFEKGLRFTYDESPFQSGIFASLPALSTIAPVDLSLFTGTHGKELLSKMLSQSAQQGLKQFSGVVDEVSIRQGGFLSLTGQGDAFVAHVHVTLLGTSFLTTTQGVKLTSTELPEGADLEPDRKGAIIARYLDRSGNDRKVNVREMGNPEKATYELKVSKDVARGLALGSQEE